MTNKNHDEAFLQRLLDMTGFIAERDAEAREIIIDEEEHPDREQQGLLPTRRTPRRKPVPR